MSDIMDYVLRGAALLDAKGPHGWRDMIDRGSLDLNDVHLCVLGQVYDQSHESRAGYDYGKETLELDIALAGSHGFTPSHTPYDSAQLTKAWRRYLRSMPPAVELVQPEVVLTHELLELFVNRMDEINDPDHSLEETVFVVNGVRIILK